MEFLAVLHGNEDKSRRVLKACSKITQVASPHILLCSGNPDDVDLRKAGVQVIRTRSDADALRGTISEAESLFVNAWLERQSQPPKDRPGEGLDWDTAPFKAP